jgi:multiple sugar transport system substrate-binding protein
MKKVISLISLILALVMVFTLAGCGSKTAAGQAGNGGGNSANSGDFDPYAGIENHKGKIIKMLVWWTLTDNEKQIIQNFTDKYGIEVKLINTTLSDYQTKLASMITSRNSPDLAALNAEYFPMAVVKNRFQPIDLNIWNLEKDSDLDIAQMKQFIWDGKYYGASVKGSWFSEKAIVFYNKSMFENAGLDTPYDMFINGEWNWDTLKETASKLTNSKKGIYGWGDRSYNRINWLLANNTDLVNFDDGKITNNLTDKKVEDSLAFISDMISSGSVLVDSTLDDFTSGKVAMYVAGSSYMQKTATLNTQMKSEWGVAPFPSPKAAETLIPNAGLVWGVPTSAKEPEAASYFIRYFLDPKNETEERVANEECKKVYEYISAAENIRTGFSLGLISFNSADDYYQILRVAKEDRNNIPILLKSYQSLVDAAITSAMDEIG